MKPENLNTCPAMKPPLVPAVGIFHDTAQFPDGQLHVVEGDTGLEFHSVEQHLRPEWDRDGTEHDILL